METLIPNIAISILKVSGQNALIQRQIKKNILKMTQVYAVYIKLASNITIEAE